MVVVAGKKGNLRNAKMFANAKQLLPTPRFELGTSRLQGERIDHFAKQAMKQYKDFYII